MCTSHYSMALMKVKVFRLYYEHSCTLVVVSVPRFSISAKTGIFQDGKESSFFERPPTKWNYYGDGSFNEDAMASFLPNKCKAVCDKKFLDLRRINLFRSRHAIWPDAIP